MPHHHHRPSNCTRGRQGYLKAVSGWGESVEKDLREVCVRCVCVSVMRWWWSLPPRLQDRHLQSSREERKMRMRSVFTCLDIPEALQRSASQRATRKAPLHSSLWPSSCVCKWVCACGGSTRGRAVMWMWEALLLLTYMELSVYCIVSNIVFFFLSLLGQPASFSNIPTLPPPVSLFLVHQTCSMVSTCPQLGLCAVSCFKPFHPFRNTELSLSP